MRLAALRTAVLLLSLLACAPSAWSQDDASPAAEPFRHNPELARELAELAWADANKLNWRHWSDANGVNIFHNRNDGRMRDVHMRHIRGNPNADNMMVAGPGFYIASDVRSSAYFGEELMDVRLNPEKAGIIDLTNAETKTKLAEILTRYNVPYPLKASSDLRKVELLNLLSEHGINGARYTSSGNSGVGERGYSWVTVWEHEAIESLRRGSSSIHVEMWDRISERMSGSWGDADPVSRVRNDPTLKKFSDYFSDAELRSFATTRSLLEGDGTATERFGTAFSDAGIERASGSEAKVELTDAGKVKVTLPADASAEVTARAFMEASIIADLASRDAAGAKRAFGPNAEANAGAEFLRENARLRALRMTEGLYWANREVGDRLAKERMGIEHKASEARYTVAAMEELRADVKSRSNIDLPESRMERLAKAFPNEFDLVRFHTEPSTYYETSKSAPKAFKAEPTIKAIRNNINAGRSLLEGTSGEMFVTEGQEGLNSLYERYETGPDADRRMIDRFIDKVAKRGGLVELVAAGDPRLPPNSQGRTIVTADGRIKVLLPADRSIKRFALIDELTHVIQFSNMAKAGSIDDVRAVLRRANEGDPAAREVLVRWEVKAKKNILLTLPEGDPARPTVKESIRRMEAEQDPFVYARRRNGSIDWKAATRNIGGGMAHFTLALFLKELAVAIQSGDRQVLEEFFDGLMTTDFYLNYGLFSAGAWGGNLFYSKLMERHLTRFVRPKFIRSIVQSNVVLAAGMALPQLLMGHWDGKAFAIDLAGLGLSSIAVKSGLEGLSWALKLDRFSAGAKIASRIGRAGRLSNVAGWLYSTVELAVVLYYGDRISGAINEALAKREAEKALKTALARFRAAATDPLTSRSSAETAARALNEAYADYRNYLYGPLKAEEVKLMARLEKATQKIKQHADGLARYEELAGSDPERFGVLRRSAEAMRRKHESADKAEIARIFASYDAARVKLLDKIYRSEAGATGVSSSELDAWAFRGGESGALGDPLGTRNDLFARISRSRARSRFDDRLNGITENRLVAYEHEAALLALAGSAARSAAARKVFSDRATELRELRERERALVLGEGRFAGSATAGAAVDLRADSIGLIRALAKATHGEGAETPAPNAPNEGR